MRKKLFIFFLLLISGVIMNYASEMINIRHITTDSGFDTSYDSGGSSSGDYGGSSSSDSSYGSDSGSSGSYNSNPIISITFGFIIMLLILLSLIKGSKNGDKSPSVYPGVEKTPEIQKLLDRAYQIFVDVQKAWMNFDYETLRQLVTDDLYNMYYNQLQTLNIKGEKNIMSNFQLNDSYVFSIIDNKDVTYYNIRLKVSFYDYIVNSNNKVIRGKKDIKVNMEYELVFVKNINSVDICPVCKAKLENGITTCPYCRSHIQGVSSKMKLSKKKVIRQW